MENKEAKNKNKNKSKLKWFILLVFIVLIIIGAIGLLYSKANSSKEANNEEEYIKQVENYAHLIEEKVSEYLSDYDRYPTWQDIKYSVREINPNVICGVTITDLGNLTLKNCTVYDIEYTGDFFKISAAANASAWAANSWYLRKIEDRMGNTLYHLNPSCSCMY